MYRVVFLINYQWISIWIWPVFNIYRVSQKEVLTECCCCVNCCKTPVSFCCSQDRDCWSCSWQRNAYELESLFVCFIQISLAAKYNSNIIMWHFNWFGPTALNFDMIFFICNFLGHPVHFLSDLFEPNYPSFRIYKTDVSNCWHVCFTQ